MSNIKKTYAGAALANIALLFAIVIAFVTYINESKETITFSLVTDTQTIAKDGDAIVSFVNRNDLESSAEAEVRYAFDGVDFAIYLARSDDKWTTNTYNFEQKLKGKVCFIEQSMSETTVNCVKPSGKSGKIIQVSAPQGDRARIIPYTKEKSQ